MRRGTLIAIVTAAAVLVAGGVAGLVWWWYDSHPWGGSVPYLSFAYDEPIAKDASGVGGLVLHAHNDTRQAQEEGYILSVANVSDKAVRFNTRPFRHAKGLSGWAEDTQGKRHPLTVRPVYPNGNLGWPVAYTDDYSDDNEPLRAADIVTLKPGARFSISITFHATDDWRFRTCLAVDAVSAEALGPFYQVKDYVLTYAYGREDGAPGEVWLGTLTSNAFTCDQKEPPVETRFRYQNFPKDLFQTLYDSLRHYSRGDAGRRLLLFQHFCLLERHGILRPGQFDQVLDWAIVDDSPLVRLWATRYPRTWKVLLLDADADVRQRTLEKAAKRPVTLGYGEITEIVATIYLYGDAGQRLLAVEALSRHGGGGNWAGRTWSDIHTKALDDPDEAVRKRAHELFGNFKPLATQPL